MEIGGQKQGRPALESKLRRGACVGGMRTFCLEWREGGGLGCTASVSRQGFHIGVCVGRVWASVPLAGETNGPCLLSG